ncbi:hypothetical protein FFWV33_09870 [Flavobacterium faecale]|uniref:Thioredoxin domain-containing protein n=1 Tax=Flavobacterium faecale TaxID=1355330 RepID=A0A2S1LIM1_9FLAO|nr:TlpA family protein disulfide reductase [Flavobacterium faecale]AWG23614.1 hypothetical protein FFWV33_09870 [Flavobacterium faecale]
MKYSLFLFVGVLFSFQMKAQNPVVFDNYQALENEILSNKNTTYVVNFWATWCAPCVKELPYFEQLNTENKMIKVVLVSLDFKDQIQSRLIPFLKRKKVQSEVVVLTDKNYNNWLEKVDQNWSGSIPATLIIQGEKRVFVERDFATFNELNQYINSNIN